MSFSTLLKFLAVAVCLAGGFYQYTKYENRRAREALVSQFASLIDPEAHSITTPKATFDRTVFQAIAFLYNTPGFHDGTNTTPQFDSVIKSACELNGLTPTLSSAYARTLRNAFSSCVELEIFDPAHRNVARMESGLAPTVRSGIYDGDDLVVAYALPPLAVPSTNNQLPNVTLVPASVRTLRGDIVDTEAFRTAIALRSAGLITPEQFAEVERIHEATSQLPH